MQGPLHALAYLLTFPVRHARVDALWLVGGGGCAVLLVASWWRRDGLIRGRLGGRGVLVDCH